MFYRDIALTAFLVTGCNQTPSNVNATPTPVPQSTVQAAAARPYSGIESLSSATPEAQESAPTTAQELPSAWEDYAQAYRDLKSVPPPQIESGIPDPTVIANYNNAVAAKLQALVQQKASIEDSLTPDEQGRWKAYQKQLQAEGQ